MSNCIITTAVNMYYYATAAAATAVVVGQLQSVGFRASTEEQSPCLYVTQFNSSSFASLLRSPSLGAFSLL